MGKVSIIIPIYNSQESLEKCIFSLLKQTYSDIELILVNDGSTDNSYTICETLVRSDIRIKLIDKKNGGPSTARNEGLRLASGKYIAFVDADDYVDNNHIRNLVKGLENNNADMSICGMCKKLNEATISLMIPDLQDFTLSESIYALFESGLFGFTCNKLIKKEILDKYLILFDEKRFLFEDQYFFMEYCKHINKIISIDSCSYYYVISNNSLSNKYDDKRLENSSEMLIAIEEYFSELQINKFLVDSFIYKYSARVIHDTILQLIFHSISFHKKCLYLSENKNLYIIKEFLSLYKKQKHTAISSLLHTTFKFNLYAILIFIYTINRKVVK